MATTAPPSRFGEISAFLVGVRLQGVDGLITDRADLLKELLLERGLWV